MATFSESVPFFLTEKIADGSCCVTSMAETLNAIQTVSIIYLISSGWLSGWGWCSGSCCSGRGRSCCSGNQGLVVEEIDWPIHRIHDHSNLLEKWSINQDQKQVGTIQNNTVDLNVDIIAGKYYYLTNLMIMDQCRYFHGPILKKEIVTQNGNKGN